MSRVQPAFPFLVSILVFLLSCTSNEIGNAKDVDPNSIYFDYKVWGDEDGGLMTVRLQYKFAGSNGTTLILENPSKVELDGELLNVDSSKMNGAYYELTKPVKDFTGRHVIVFTDKNGKQYKEEFTFKPIELTTTIPKVVNRSDLVFELDGVAPRDLINIRVSDTAMFSEGIVRVDTVRNSRIVITKDDLKPLVNGPIHLEFSKEDEKRVKNGTKEGGRFSISYEIKREFELKEAVNP